MFGFLPSVIYSWYIISKYPTPEHVLITDLESHHHHHDAPPGYGTL